MGDMRQILPEWFEAAPLRLILGGARHGNLALLPKLTFTPSDTVAAPCEFRRRQFPVRVAFALTINKSQGQTLDHVGVYLRCPIFAHGHLYVALSRCA
jgi:ATP-dependent DNA helicase PIF1